MAISEIVHEEPSIDLSHEAVSASGTQIQPLEQTFRKDFYIPTLDGIRAIAFLLVFIAHAGLDNLVPGGFGVTVFFFLSGYLITTMLRLEAIESSTISLKKFYLRRAFRILPPLYVTLAIAYGLGATGILRESGNLFGLFAASAYFYNYTDLLHKAAILPTGTGVLWSLMVEEHFYLIFPFIYLLFIRHKVSVRKQVNILLGYCVVALSWRMVLVFALHTPLLTLPRWTYSASEARFDSILFGCILAIRNNSNLGDPSPLLRKYKGILAIAGLAAIFASLLYREPHFRETFRYTMQSAALYPIFYYCVSSWQDWRIHWLEWKPLRYLGWVSYTMYLFHFVLLSIGRNYLHLNLVFAAVLAFPLALLYSSLMRTYVERPSRRWKSIVERRIFSRA